MSGAHLADLQRDLHEISLACIHCGLCLPECPTYVALENEMDSPRGRIYLMRAMAAGELQPSDPVARHLDLCLDCRGCESVCPSNVRYGTLLERTRERLSGHGGPPDGQSGAGVPARPPKRWDARLVDWLVFNVLPYPGRMRAALRVGRMARALGLVHALRRSRWLHRLSPGLAQAVELMPDRAPAEPRPSGRASRPEGRGSEVSAPRGVGPIGARRAAVQFFTGCATGTLTPENVGQALNVLRHNGCAARCPAGQVCCGAIHYHAGRRFEARDLARANVDAFEGDEPIVNIAAGCGAMMKHYGELLADDPQYAGRAERFARRVRDISELLCDIGPRPPARTVPMRVAYHDACHHCHAQGIRREPRELLRLIAGLELVECESSETCCGAAGSYNLTQPQVAAELGRRKLEALSAGGATVAATGNVGCILHLRATARRLGSNVQVVHTVDLLSRAYGATP